MTDHHRKLENMYLAAPVNDLYQPTIRIDDGRAVIEMDADPRFFHAGGALHGSAYFKALDDAAYFAVNSLVDDAFVVTVSFNIYLLRPVTGGRLRAEGRVVSGGRNSFVAEAVLYVDGDTQVARGSGTFQRSRVALDEVEAYRQEEG
jgi:uncharacterized protein (TIGR00369 family)